MSGSLESDSAEIDELTLHDLDVSNRSCIESSGTIAAEPASGIIFITGNPIDASKARFAAELAKRDRSLLIGIFPGINLSKLGAVGNLRLMLHFCDTVVIENPMEKLRNFSPVRLRRSVIASAICKGLSDRSNQRPLRNMLKRGQLARVGSAKSTNVEEAILKALRAILPVAEFSHSPEIFLHISSSRIDRNLLARASTWISKALDSSNTILCSTYRRNAVEAKVCLLATGIAVPYSPSSRSITMDIDELEPESDSDNEIAMALGLDQME